MITLYLDHQIYTYLKNRNNHDMFMGTGGIQRMNTVNKLYDFLKKEKSNFLIFYSHAHMLDLSSDKSGNKERLLDDLKLREEFVENNYLVFNEKDNGTDYQLAYPETKFEPFWEKEEELDFSNIFDISHLENFMETEKFQELKEQKELVDNLKLPSLDDLVSDDVKENEDYQKLKDILGFMNGGNFNDLVKGFTDFAKRFQEEKGFYKELRNIVTAGVEKTKTNGILPNSEETNFIYELANTNLNSPDKENFVVENLLSYVKKQWSDRNKDKEPTSFDLHYQSYLMLDMWGIEKEKVTIARNMLHDGHHSFYGGHCEIVVSDDKNFRAKSNLLYKLFGLSTQVYSMEEFMKQSFSVELERVTNISDFVKRIKYDLKTGLVSNSNVNRIDSYISELKPSMKYLHYFNKVLLLKEEGKDYLVLRHEVQTYLKNLPYRIVQEITNKAVQIFGMDNFAKGNFNWEIECAEIKSGNWQGRNWTFSDIDIMLQISPQKYYFQLVIG